MVAAIGLYSLWSVISELFQKKAKETEKFDKEVKKLDYERKLRQMDMETLLKIEQLSASKEKKKFLKPTSTPTGIN